MGERVKWLEAAAKCFDLMYTGGAEQISVTAKKEQSAPIISAREKMSHALSLVSAGAWPVYCRRMYVGARPGCCRMCHPSPMFGVAYVGNCPGV
jgi:hypothetical protein